MRKTLLVLLIPIFTISLYAQNSGGIKGEVKTPAGNPAEQVNVIVQKTSLGARTNSAGI